MNIIYNNYEIQEVQVYLNINIYVLDPKPDSHLSCEGPSYMSSCGIYLVTLMK